MLLVNKHLLLFSTEEKAYYSALISLCGDRVVLVLVLYLQGSINIFTEGRQEGCEQSQAASPAQFPHPMPRRGCRDGYRAESWHGAASPGSPTSAPVPGGLCWACRVPQFDRVPAPSPAPGQTVPSRGFSQRWRGFRQTSGLLPSPKCWAYFG